MAFADGVQHFVVPQRGRLALRRVLDVLARVQSKLVEPTIRARSATSRGATASAP